MQATVFISHHEAAVARELDRLIEKCFKGRIRTFNTSRVGRGMAAGDHIDPSLIAQINQADVIVSLWTPNSITSPAWMAWELGAAVALKPEKVLVARALGLLPADLPLNLRSIYCPDLGDADECLEFLNRLQDAVGADQEQSVDSELRTQFDRNLEKDEPNPMRAVKVEGVIHVTGGAEYLLVENYGEYAASQFRTVGQHVTEGAQRFATFVNRAGGIEASGRLVVPISKLKNTLPQLGMLEWQEAGGRRWQNVEVVPSPYSAYENSQ